jgi:putative FmdB family regulatory protein
MAHHWQSPGESASPATDFPHHQGATAVPTYQYACTNPEGRHEFELVQSFTDAPVTECPECGAPVRKVYGSVGVVFKGSGFYRTDSRKSATASDSPASSASPATEGSSGSPAKKEGSSSPAPAAAPSSSSGSSGSKAAN